MNPKREWQTECNQYSPCVTNIHKNREKIALCDLRLRLLIFSYLCDRRNDLFYLSNLSGIVITRTIYMSFLMVIMARYGGWILRQAFTWCLMCPNIRRNDTKRLNLFQYVSDHIIVFETLIDAPKIRIAAMRVSTPGKVKSDRRGSS